MLKLLPETKTLVAGNDSEAWFRMWRYDPEFREWAESERGRKLFVDLFTVVKITECGHQIWRLFGEIYRGNDLPAVIWANGTQEWWQNGGLHRDGDLPAVIRLDRTQERRWQNCQEWWQNGRLHRGSDLPAVVYADGAQHWYQNSKLHRNSGLPAVIWADGTQEWWQHGKKVK